MSINKYIIIIFIFTVCFAQARKLSTDEEIENNYWRKQILKDRYNLNRARRALYKCQKKNLANSACSDEKEVYRIMVLSH